MHFTIGKAVEFELARGWVSLRSGNAFYIELHVSEVLSIKAGGWERDYRFGN